MELNNFMTLVFDAYGLEMTLNLWMMVERYPKPNGVFGGLVSDCEVFSLLDGKKLAMWSCASCVLKTIQENI